MQLFDHIPDQTVDSCLNWQVYDVSWQPGSEIVDVARKVSKVRTEFWDLKILWRRERQYVAIPNMEVW